MAKENRKTRDIVICVETIVNDLKIHFENHLSHHEARDKELRRNNWALIIVTVGAVLTSVGSLIAALIILGLN